MFFLFFFNLFFFVFKEILWNNLCRRNFPRKITDRSSTSECTYYKQVKSLENQNH